MMKSTCFMPEQFLRYKEPAKAHLLATVKTASVAALAFSFSPKVMTGLKAKGFSREVNLLRDTTNESIT